MKSSGSCQILFQGKLKLQTRQPKIKISPWRISCRVSKFQTLRIHFKVGSSPVVCRHNCYESHNQIQYDNVSNWIEIKIKYAAHNSTDLINLSHYFDRGWSKLIHIPPVISQFLYSSDIIAFITCQDWINYQIINLNN